MVRATRVVGALIVAFGVAVAATGFYLYYSEEGGYVSFFVTAAGTALAYGGIALYLKEPIWGAGLPPGATPS